MLIEEIKNIKSDKKELKKFGCSVGIVLLMLAILLFFYDRVNLSCVLSGTGTFLILSGYILPGLLLPFQKLWMVGAIIMGFISSHVILTILYYLVVTPIGLLAKLFGKKFLDAKIEKDAETYWELRLKVEYKKEQTDRQF